MSHKPINGLLKLKHMKKMIFTLTIILFVVSATYSQQTKNQNKAKYVFLFIGDGMGVNQVYLTELFLGIKDSSVVDKKMIFNKFPVNSNMTTYSKSGYITCSSASATAMSTGFKTVNGTVCKSADLKHNYKTLSTKIKQAGYKVGIVSSVSIDHATPACFYANQDSRDEYYEISMQLPNIGIDYFGGGGFKEPKGKNNKLPSAYENAIKKGYKYVNTHKDFNKLKAGDKKIFAVNPNKYTEGEFFWAIDKKENQLSLNDFTKKGIELLDNKQGFFMMVEGGKIDWACHLNDAGSMVHEVVEFNKAIKTAYEFYKNKPNETLIIVTADHETGGLFTGIDKIIKPELLYYQKASIQEFDNKMEILRKKEQKPSFEQIMKMVSEDFGVGKKNSKIIITDNELELLKEAYNYEFKINSDINPNDSYLTKTKNKTIAEIATHLLNQKAGVGWGSFHHTAMPVPVRVIGCGQGYFAKYFDNADLSKLIIKAMKID